jgi:hypothetical protein
MEHFVYIALMSVGGLFYAWLIMKVMATVYFDTKKRYLNELIANINEGDDDGSFK